MTKKLSTPKLITSVSREEVRQTLSYEQSLTFGNSKGKGADMALTQEVGRILGQLYPEHLWGVRVSHRQGIIEVRMACFSDYSYVIHIHKASNPNELHKKVKEAGGAFLEIFNQPRSRMDPGAYSDMMTKLNIMGPAARKVDPGKIDLTPKRIVSNGYKH